MKKILMAVVLIFMVIVSVYFIKLKTVKKIPESAKLVYFEEVYNNGNSQSFECSW